MQNTRSLNKPSIVGRREEGRKQEKEGGLFQGRKDPLFELIVIIIIFFVVRKIIPSRGRNTFCRGWKAVVKRGWCTPSSSAPLLGH